jgi:hypothetical protein
MTSPRYRIPTPEEETRRDDIAAATLTVRMVDGDLFTIGLDREQVKILVDVETPRDEPVTIDVTDFARAVTWQRSPDRVDIRVVGIRRDLGSNLLTLTVGRVVDDA